MNTNKLLIIIVIILAVIITILTGFLFLPTEEIKAPTVPTLMGIEIFSPKANEIISSPINISGLVNGNGWFGFEGQVGVVKLKDDNGKELALGILTAQGEWMQKVVNFKTNIKFSNPATSTGTLVFYNENPSGDPDKDKTFVLPVRFK